MLESSSNNTFDNKSENISQISLLSVGDDSITINQINLDFFIENFIQKYENFNSPNIISFNPFSSNVLYKTDSTDQNIKIFKGKKRGKNSRKFGTDNILTKVNAHFINFVISFINIILDIFDIEGKFIKIEYKKITKKIFPKLKDTIIGEIIRDSKISPKFKIKSKENNSELYDKIKNIPFINQIFTSKYIDLFKTIYLKKERIITVKKDGEDINIKLSKRDVKMFEDLLEKNKEDPLYIERLRREVIKEFLSDY